MQRSRASGIGSNSRSRAPRGSTGWEASLPREDHNIGRLERRLTLYSCGRQRCFVGSIRRRRTEVSAWTTVARSGCQVRLPMERGGPQLFSARENALGTGVDFGEIVSRSGREPTQAALLVILSPVPAIKRRLHHLGRILLEFVKSGKRSALEIGHVLICPEICSFKLPSLG